MEIPVASTTMAVPHKTDVGKRFDKAFGHYDQHAVVQQQMAKTLVNKALPHIDASHRFFEIGCGSGLLTNEVFEAKRPDCYIGIDLAPASAKCIETICKTHHINNFNISTADAEETEYPLNCDVIWSGATVQWFGNRPKFIHDAACALKQNGTLAFSTFGPHNFHQIKEITKKALCYDALLDWQQMLAKHFKIVAHDEWHQTLWFNSALDVLRHIKSTGVGATNTNAWTKTELRNFEQGYQRFFNSTKGYPLTYHPLLFVAKKRDV